MKIGKIRKFEILLFLIFSTVFSFKIPEKPTLRVNDYANVFSSDFISKLEMLLLLFEINTGNQLVVVTIPSLDGEEIESFSIKLVEKWKIGKKGLDNGVIVLLALKERKIRIEVGYGLENKLTDALSSVIINNYMVPYLKNGNFENGIERGIQKIIEVISEDKEKNIDYTFSKNKSNSNNYSFVGIILIILIYIFLIDIIRYQFVKHKFKFWEWFFLFSITYLLLRIVSSIPVKGYGGGSGGFKNYKSDGFSGGGGGRFGGGGASGRW